jgi:type II secretory ATPase GspE/PulE/Tfp pilus assembly ATPase PilB-like protein
MSQPSDSSQFPSFSQPEPSSAEVGDRSNPDFEQTFQLIDSLVPLESCRHHQVVPLSLFEKCLTLGIVNLKNSTAIDYIRSLLASQNFSLKVQPIDAKSFQSILAAYTKSTQTPQPKTPKPRTAPFVSEQPTLIVDNPDELAQGATEETNLSLSKQPSEPTDSPPRRTTNFNEQPTLIVDNPENLSPELAGNSSDTPILKKTESNSSSEPPTAKPSLEVKAYSIAEPVDFLATLSPQKLWQELLSRVLSEGIGRLYFERHPDRGRIFWSKNGVLQLSLENILPSIFQGTMDEFKRLVQLPATPLQQAKKGEIERFYRQERLLIRWQTIPGKYGEEGTLQVLRGKASELYQQRQLDELSTQALRLAESLEKKLKQITTVSRLSPTRLEVIPALRQLQEKIDKHLESLEQERS